jgi:hypothetical protein
MQEEEEEEEETEARREESGAGSRGTKEGGNQAGSNLPKETNGSDHPHQFP